MNRLLKLDPKNTELLAQKQKLLKEAIGETKEKLAALKEADKQAKAQLEAGTLGQEKYDALQREIQETERQLKELQNTAGSSSAKLAEMSTKLEDFGSKAESAGKKMLPITGTVMALGAASVKTAADFDSSMSNVQAISGATADDMEKLRDKAREMGEKTTFSATEAGDAMSYMAMAGWKTGDMLSGIEGIMNLAAASGEDLATTSDIVTDALTAFGMTAKESGELADIMAAASSNANTNVSLLGESFKYVAPLFGAMNYSADDAAVALGLMANAGIKGSQAGTALKTAIANMASPTEKMAKVMKEYGISLTNTDGSMKSFGEVMDVLREKMGGLSETEQAAAASNLFGKEAMAGMLSIINAAPADYEKLKNAVESADGAASKMADTMNDNLKGQLTILKSQLEELAISIGEILMPFLRSLVTWIQGLVDKFNGMSDTQKKVIVIIGMLVAAIGPLLITIGKMATGVSAVMSLFSKLSGIGGVITKFGGTVKAVLGGIGTAAKGLWSIIAANPVIAIITLVVAAVILLYNKCEWFRDGVNGIISAVIEFFGNLGSTTSEIFNAAAETIGAAVTSIQMFFGNLKQQTEETWQRMKDAVVGTAVNLVSGAVNAFANMVSGAKNATGKMKDAVESGFKSAINYITGLPGKAIKWGGDFVDGIAKGIKNMAHKVTDAVKGLADKIASFLHFSRPDEGPLHEYETWMPDFVDGMVRTLKSNQYKITDAVKNMAGEMADGTMSMNVLATAGNMPINLESNTMVQIGNESIDGYITKTAMKGINKNRMNTKKVKGRN